MTSQVLSTQVSTAVQAWTRLLRATASARRCLSARLDGEHSLTVNDFEALSQLAHAGEGSMRRVDLAESLQLTPSGVTRLLDGLEQAGLVEKASCPSDARVSYAVLTDTGRAKLEQASCSHVRAIEALFEDRYSADELASLAELLGRLPGAE
jgi:DNA-binding MarR family transcriptional regulator